MFLGFRKLNLRVVLLNTAQLGEYTDLVVDVRSSLKDRGKSLVTKQLDSREEVAGKQKVRMGRTYQ